MATIRRHPVPPESYNPDRPLNDLGRDQLKHYIHVAERLPAHLRVDVPVPSPEDGLAASRFIAAVTERLLSNKQVRPQLVGKRRRLMPNIGLTLAAGADSPQPPTPIRNPQKRLKSKSRSRDK